MLDSYPNHTSDVDQETIDAGENLMETLRQFKIEAKVSAIVKGPTVTMYELTLAPGVRVSSISNLADNIAMELAARQVRIVALFQGSRLLGLKCQMLIALLSVLKIFLVVWIFIRLQISQ